MTMKYEEAIKSILAKATYISAETANALHAATPSHRWASHKTEQECAYEAYFLLNSDPNLRLMSDIAVERTVIERAAKGKYYPTEENEEVRPSWHAGPRW